MPDTKAIELIDTHAHLDSSDYNRDRAAVIADAFAAKIGVITVGADIESSAAAVKLAERHRCIWAAVGVHPHDAKTLDPAGMERLRAMAKQSSVVAIGEIGLDYYRDLSPRNVQRQAFVDQIELADELELPVIVHNRESTKDMLAILRNHRPKSGVIHSFLGDRALAEEFIDLGFHLGIGGPLTFDKNEILREAVAAAPLDRILIETDCPYLTPVPYRGKRNEPAYVRYVAEEIARLKDITFEQVAQATTQNAVTLFSIPLA
jgi:TatD DNase family protein